MVALLALSAYALSIGLKDREEPLGGAVGGRAAGAGALQRGAACLAGTGTGERQPRDLGRATAEWSRIPLRVRLSAEEVGGRPIGGPRPPPERVRPQGQDTGSDDGPRHRDPSPVQRRRGAVEGQRPARDDRRDGSPPARHKR